MLASVISGQKDLKQAAIDAGSTIGAAPKSSSEEAEAKVGVVDYSTYLGGDGSDPVVSCSLEIAVPALLHFVYRYADHGVKTALLASTNAGGENVARGSPLGALFGAFYGIDGFPETLRTLHHRVEIEQEIDNLVGGFP